MCETDRQTEQKQQQKQHLLSGHPFGLDALHDADGLNHQANSVGRTLQRADLHHVVLVERLEAGQGRLQGRQGLVQVLLRVVSDGLRLLRLHRRHGLLLLHHLGTRTHGQRELEEGGCSGKERCEERGGGRDRPPTKKKIKK